MLIFRSAPVQRGRTALRRRASPDHQRRKTSCSGASVPPSGGWSSVTSSVILPSMISGGTVAQLRADDEDVAWRGQADLDAAPVDVEHGDDDLDARAVGDSEALVNLPDENEHGRIL